MNERQEGLSKLVVTRGDASELLDAVEEAFDQIAALVDVPVKRTRIESVGSRRNNGCIVLEWIARLRDEGLTVLFTTHHPHHAHAVADDALLMFGQDDYACGPVDEVLTEANLLRLYGVSLRQVTFQHDGESLASLVPVYRGLRRSPVAG